MLQIKKLTKLVSINFFLQTILKSKLINKHYYFKKSISHSITLRSPKHFNIGKNKICNLNYKSFNLIKYFNLKLQISSLFSDNLYHISKKIIKNNTTLNTKSLKVKLLTKFKIKWLEFLYQ